MTTSKLTAHQSSGPVLTFKSLWMIGVWQWWSRDTASHTSQNIRNTSPSENPVCNRSFIWAITSPTNRAGHYSEVIMGAMAFQITGVLIVYSTDQRKHQSSTLLAFVRGIHRWPVNSLHKRPVMWKMFPFDVIMFLHHCFFIFEIDGLVQERHNSSALVMELCLSCTNASKYSLKM